MDYEGFKYVELNDSWEHFKVQLNIYNPKMTKAQEMRAAGEMTDWVPRHMKPEKSKFMT